TNTLLVIGNPIEMDYLVSIMPIVDIPIPQVMIELKLIELTEAASRRLGMSYGFGQNQYAASFNNSTPGTVGTDPTINRGAQPQILDCLIFRIDASRVITANCCAELIALMTDSQARFPSNSSIDSQRSASAKFQSSEFDFVVEVA